MGDERSGISPEVRQVVDEMMALACCYEAILPPLDVLAEARRLAGEGESGEITIGCTGKGRAIHAYRMGSGRHPVLLYGFPDPGEAVGGTGILALMRGLLEGSDFLASFDATWHFIPCLNLDDQPCDGRELRNVMHDPAVREVDWCLHDPRPETTALVDYARAVRPVFTFPMHDEYHCGEPMAMYFPVVGQLDPQVCRWIRQAVEDFNVRIDSSRSHPQLGEGFFIFEPDDPEYSHSTMSVLAEYGTVLVAEVSRQQHLSPAAHVACQLTAGLIAMASRLPHSGAGSAPVTLFM